MFIQSWRIRQSFGGDFFFFFVYPKLAYQAELWRRFFCLSKVGVSGRALEEIFLFIQSWRIRQSFGGDFFVYPKLAYQAELWKENFFVYPKLAYQAELWKENFFVYPKLAYQAELWKKNFFVFPKLAYQAELWKKNFFVFPKLPHQAELWRRLLFAHSWRIRQSFGRDCYSPTVGVSGIALVAEFEILLIMIQSCHVKQSFVALLYFKYEFVFYQFRNVIFYFKFQYIIVYVFLFYCCY